jgi:hypothetical protein
VRSRGGSGEAVAAVGGVGFPPLRASGKRSRSSLLVKPGDPRFACFFYRHGGRGPLPTDLVVTPPFKALTDLWRETRARFDRSGLRSIQHSDLGGSLATQVEIGEGLSPREKRYEKLEILWRVRGRRVADGGGHCAHRGALGRRAVEALVAVQTPVDPPHGW